MANCPNCGRSTVRTQDWACQWCGYPLVSGFFKKIEMTYQEARAERLHGGIVIGTAVELESPVAEAEVIEEIEETGEALAEVEIAEEAEETGEAVAEAEVIEEAEEPSEAMAEAEVIEEAEKGVEAVAEAEVTEVAEEPTEAKIVPITLEELNRVCGEDSEAAEARFAGTILQVIGVVVRIPPMESTENPCIILTNSEKSVARNLLCVFDRQHEAAIKQLSVGQMVTVQGKYDGCVINILLNDCVLAK